ncbi:MAG: DNA replication/repair protein RecF [Flavobacteriales bacterium]|nr:DNA replication/repair protein RecF [Flavobacteriales bacterium]
MYLKKLTLSNFKNHSESDFQFGKRVNCFVGDNGSGKTNILDAIHYLSLSKSYFNKIDSQNIKFNEDFFIIKGDFIKAELQSSIQCSLQKGEQKILKYNGKKYKRFSDHIGSFPIVVISPTDSNIILDGSDVRRKYIDSSIAQYNMQYLKNLIDYNKVLKQRNALLKSFSEKGYFDKLTLETFDDQLIKFGTEIFKERKHFLERLISVFKKYYVIIAGEKEKVNIVYKSQLDEDTFKNVLRNSLSKDRINHYTNVGVHKDDIVFEMNNYLIKKIGSQGQQKSFLIALKLAQFDFLEKQMGFKPTLLLDDIFDKLDDKRIEKIISFAKNEFFGQVFITDTHKERTEIILNKSRIEYTMYKIENGRVI